EWREGAESGEIVEAFACGTAAVITPISEIKSTSIGIRMPEVEERVSLSLRDELTGIQYGRIDDRHGWLRRLDGRDSRRPPPRPRIGRGRDVGGVGVRRCRS